MDGSLTTLWKRVCGRLQQMVAPQIFKRWFAPIRVSHQEGDCLCLHAPSHLYRYWLEDNYGDLLRETLSAVAGRPMALRFLRPEDEDRSEADRKQEVGGRRPEIDKGGGKSRSGLKTVFTFGNFVVGPSNQYAHAGCWAVAQSPGRAYNPLFIYGATGLGKTHLMHAVGHHLLEQDRSVQVAYVSMEKFVNEFIDAIQNKKFVPFRKKYRSCDVLLVDDVHFLGRGDQMQEEFFHTFNTLFEAQKQIVLSSDRSANEIANLEQRLVSRFEWGLTVQLQQPDEETRLAILRKKQEQSTVPISEEVLGYLARHIKTNIRRLEGAWQTVWFTTRLKGRALSLVEVEEKLQEVLMEESRQALTVETIQKRVAAYYDIRLAEMTGKRRTASVVFPRQVAMYLCRVMTRGSLNEIGEGFGGRDHGTVMHACRLVEQRLKTDMGLKQAINQLSKQLAR